MTFQINYIPHYLKPATQRLSVYMPEGFSLSINDTHAIQRLCLYEIATFQSSDFCGLFTLDEWRGFEYMTDLTYYGGYSVESILFCVHPITLLNSLCKVW